MHADSALTLLTPHSCRDSQVQKHLAKVYITLTLCVLAAAAGCYASIQYASILAVSQFAAFGCLLVMGFVSDKPENLVSAGLDENMGFKGCRCAA